MDKDDYLQNPIMRRFLKKHNLEFVENRADYKKAIEDFSNLNEENAKEVQEWLLKILKEGSKEICYKKIYAVDEWHKDPILLEAKIKEVFPDCPMQNILSYRNTGDRTMIEYYITTNQDDEVTKVDFTFSQLFLYGEIPNVGDVTIYPLFIEIYMDKGFVTSRGKAKSTLFKYEEENRTLSRGNKVDTMDYAISTLNKIIDIFKFETENNLKRLKNENSQMLYRIYEKYSFTPADVVEKIESQKHIINDFVNQIFSNLNLDPRNKAKAITDTEIFAEKFISINGNNEDIFKVDRPAYLVKVSADDEIELTRIDTSSEKNVPLQCTEAFFDSKKSVIRSKKCKTINLIFKRNDDTYFLKNNPLVVQLGTYKIYGYVKTKQYAEEADIQNVLQAIFRNY